METFEITLPSALFPFTLADLPDFVHGRYRLQNVFRSAGPREQQACVEFWIRGGVLVSPKAAWERSREVCYMLKEDATGRLVGVNSLYPDRAPGGGPTFFQNRMYIHPDFRDSRLMIVATAATLCYAKTRLDGEGIPGIVNVNENAKLARPGMRRIFSRLGYRRLPQEGGRDAWYFDFAHTRIREKSDAP
jgi:hypothetical protein